jgi:hypothetical protein
MSIKSISKFNTPLKKSNFLNNFHILLLEKLIMVKEGRYSKEAMNKATMKLLQKNGTDININIDPILLSCTISPEFYFEVQETVKKLTGNLIPMDELIRFLLGYLVVCYQKKYLKKQIQPFIREFPSKRFRKLSLFKLKMRRFFKNHVPDLQTQAQSQFPKRIDKTYLLK